MTAYDGLTGGTCCCSGKDSSRCPIHQMATKDRPQRDALTVAYNALLAIGCISSEIHSAEWFVSRTRQIVNAALTELNGEHTQAVQKALGIGE